VLENLEIVGGGNSPPGPFPETFSDLTALTALHLENTALAPLPDTLQNITSLTLVRTAQVGASLPVPLCLTDGFSEDITLIGDAPLLLFISFASYCRA
jgi:hypothetical protein